ncbi:MAG: hypothetical protein ACM3L6_07920, partial [Deltaproteobacteria bacterium]
SANGGNNENAVFHGNIIYASNPDNYLFLLGDEPVIGDAFKGLTFKDNIWYHAGRAKSFRLGPSPWGLYDADFKTWQKKCGDHCSGNIYQDPRLKNVRGYSWEDVEPETGSPAIEAGIRRATADGAV